MPSKTLFNPEKISLIDFKMLKGQVETPEDFDMSKVIGHHVDNTLQFGFNLEDKLAKAEFAVSIKTDCKGKNEIEASGEFQLIFVYRIENLEELVQPEKNKRLKLDPGLANALASVSYSTARGILLTRLQGTALQNFVLPIINPNNLLSANS